jgi:hypothetical protein
VYKTTACTTPTFVSLIELCAVWKWSVKLIVRRSFCTRHEVVSWCISSIAPRNRLLLGCVDDDSSRNINNSNRRQSVGGRYRINSALSYLPPTVGRPGELDWFLNVGFTMLPTIGGEPGRCLKNVTNWQIVSLRQIFISFVQTRLFALECWLFCFYAVVFLFQLKHHIYLFQFNE